MIFYALQMMRQKWYDYHNQGNRANAYISGFHQSFGRCCGLVARWAFPGLKFAIQAQEKRVKLNGVGRKALRQRRQGRV